MILSFTGAQSTGKTTLLNSLKDRHYANYEYKFVPEVTRKVQREFNLPINEEGNLLTQTMIIAEHIRNVCTADPKVTNILDRCIVDGLVYTTWLYRNNQVPYTIYQHCSDIYDALINKYDIIFYTSAEGVPLEDDGERSVDKDFRQEILHEFERVIIPLSLSLIHISEPTRPY